MSIDVDLENHFNEYPTEACEECGENIRLKPTTPDDKLEYEEDHKVFHGDVPMETGPHGWVHEPADIATEDLHSHHARPQGGEDEETNRRTIEETKMANEKANRLIGDDMNFNMVVNKNPNLGRQFDL